MHWRLFATLSEAADTDRIPVEDADTVGEALDALVATHPDLEAEILDDDGSLQEHIRLLHDGSDPFRAGEGLSTPVEEGDELALFPPVSGG
jgi:molybdopterin synthase sulfur carrier subunit